MASFGDALLICIQETDLITWIGTVCAVLYVILALKESVWCWSFGIVGSALYVSVNFHEKLWYDALLNVFYVVLGIYGWIQWAKENRSTELTAAVLQNQTKADVKPELTISKIPSASLFICVSIAVVAGIIMGYVSNAISENRFAFMDALLTSFSVVATWMTAKKFIENWLFWIVIDAGYVVLYFVKGPHLYLVALLFIFYTFMAIAGYFAWRKSIKA